MIVKFNELTNHDVIKLLETNSLMEISKQYNYNYMKLYYWCRNNNIKLSIKNNGKSKTAIKSRELNSVLIGKEIEIKKLYIDMGLSLAKIGKLYNVSAPTIMKFLVKLDVKLNKRNGKKEIKIPKVSKEELYDLYVNKKLSTYQIAEILEYANHATVAYDLKLYNIIRRNYKEAGKNTIEKNPEFKEHLTKIGNLFRTGKLLNTLSTYERRFVYWARERNLNIISQYQIYKDGHHYDFYIPELNLLLEIDGVYWHCTDEAIKRDRIFDIIAKKNDYKILHITDKYIIKYGDNCFYEIYEV